jgi:hypothetical protein
MTAFKVLILEATVRSADAWRSSLPMRRALGIDSDGMADLDVKMDAHPARTHMRCCAAPAPTAAESRGLIVRYRGWLVPQYVNSTTSGWAAARAKAHA